MKVVIFANSSFYIINFLKHHIHALIDNGHEVHVIVPHSNRERNFQNPRTHFPIILHTLSLDRKRINPIREVYCLFELWKILHSISADTIINFTIRPVIYGTFVAHRAKIKNIYSVITGLGFVFSGNSFYQRLLRKLVLPLYRISFPKNKTVLFQNKDDKKFFQEKGIVNERSEIINGSGVDLKYFSRIAKGKPNSFIMVARLLKDKGVYEFIDAAREVKKCHPKVIIDLMGPMDSNPASISKKDLQEWISSKVINYIPPSDTEGLKKQLEKHQVFILPSYREGLPRSTLEAMSMAMPIITTDVPGCRETVAHNKNGLLVAPKDSHALQQAMNEFLDNPQLVESFGNESRKMCQERFDVNKVVQRMIDICGLCPK